MLNKEKPDLSKLRVVIKHHEDMWQEIKDAAMTTIGKDKGKYPDSQWKRDILKAEQIEISILDNVLYNANELERLANAETAVLVGNVGITTYDEIIKETLLLNREHINILGYIMAV